MHPIALLPAVVGTFAMTGSHVHTTRIAWIVGALGLILAELASRWAHARTSHRINPARPSLRGAPAFLAVPIVPMAWAAAVALALPTLPSGAAVGAGAGAWASLATGLLLALPLRSTPFGRWMRDRSERPSFSRSRFLDRTPSGEIPRAR